MNRLRYSQNGGVRALQISTAKIFVFVEGALDRACADKLLRAISRGVDGNYQVRSIKEYSGTGGKTEVLKLFKHMRSKAMLDSDRLGKRCYLIFLLDKDADDLTRRIISSRHIVYTTTYDLEGQLFLAGEVHDALAAACFVTRADAVSLLPDKDNFTKSLARTWGEWVALCLLSTRLKVNCGCTFDRLSAVNEPFFNSSDPAKVSDFINEIANRRNLTATQALGRFRRVRKHHADSIESGHPFRYFKGKWLGCVLEKHVRTKNGIVDGNFNGVFDRVLAAVLGQINRDNAHRFWPDFVSAVVSGEDRVFGPR